MSRAAAPSVVRAQVSHRRSNPLRYEFTASTPMWLVDAAEPNAAFPRWLRWAAAIRPEDHFTADDARPLLLKLREYLDAQQLGWTAERVSVLTGARSFGHVFDPLTTYFCHDAGGRLEGVVAEVHNTYGERHCYALRVPEGVSRVDKAFYVSPFFTVEGRYDVRTRLTGSQVAVAITLTQHEQQVFTASVHGDLRPAGRARTLRTVLLSPAPSLRVSALIRWHGIRLWLRHLPVVPRTPATSRKGIARP